MKFRICEICGTRHHPEFGAFEAVRTQAEKRYRALRDEREVCLERRMTTETAECAEET